MGKQNLFLKSAEEHCEKPGSQVPPQRPQFIHRYDYRLYLGTGKGVLNNVTGRALVSLQQN